MKQLFASILTFLITFVIMIPESVMAANYTLSRELLVNGGFEQEANWQVFGNGGFSYVTDVKHGGSKALKVVGNSTGQNYGVYQRVDLNQTERAPVNLTGWVKGQNIVNGPGGYFGGALYAEIYMNDGSVAYWNTIINTGTFDWRPLGFSIGNLPSVTKPISHIFVVAMIGNATGTAWFDDLHLTEYKSSGAAVTFMFDDGEDNVLKAKAILDAKGFKASAPIPSSVVGQPGNVTRAQVRTLINGGWEIMGHGVNHDDMTQMSLTTLRNELRQPITFFKNNFGVTIRSVAWPYGAYNGLVIQEARAAGYRSGRAYEIGSTGGATLPFDVKIRSLEQGVTGATVAGWMNDAKANNRWVVLVGHSVVPQGDDKYFTTEAQLKEIVNAVAASGLSVMTYDQGLNAFALDINPAVVAAIAASTPTPTPTTAIVASALSEDMTQPSPTVTLTLTPPIPIITTGGNYPTTPTPTTGGIKSSYDERLEQLRNRLLENRLNLQLGGG